MKKATLQFIATYLSENTQYADEIEKSALDAALLEINAELNKGEAQKAKNAEAYDALHDVIVDNLSGTPVTCGELWDAIKDDVPEGTTKGKVQYALTHLWQDEIVKIDGKPNSYRKA